MDEGVKCWFYLFLFFLYGYYNRKENVNGSKWNIAGIAIFVILFYGYKKLCDYYPMFIPYQFLLMPGFLFGIIYHFRRTAAVLVKIPINRNFKNILIEISNLTLDIYIVQIILIKNLMPMIIFPLNVVILLIIILITAYINNRLAKKLSNIVDAAFF
jgi:hypothetical protein